MPAPQGLRIRRARDERRGDTPRDVYEVEREKPTLQHVSPVVDYIPMPVSIPREMQPRWDAIVSAMSATRMLSPTDLPLLETAFLAMHRQEQASRTLAMEGPVLYDKTDAAYPHPAIKILEGCGRLLTQCSKQLGWDILTRLQNPVPQEAVKDPDDPTLMLEA